MLSDLTTARESAAAILVATKNIDMSLFTGKAHLYWMDQENAIKSHTESIAESNDLEEQRDQFHFLSQALIKSVHVFGISGDAYFVQHCPIANNDAGPDWIRREHEIFNPYFGERMLKCGYVTDTINKLNKIHEHE